MSGHKLITDPNAALLTFLSEAAAATKVATGRDMTITLGVKGHPNYAFTMVRVGEVGGMPILAPAQVFRAQEDGR